jgi:hypothetical protein
MIFKEDGVQLDKPLKLIKLTFVQFHQPLIQVIVDIQIIEILHHLLAVLFLPPKLEIMRLKTYASINEAALQIEDHLVIIFVLQHRGVLHHNNVQWVKIVGLECEYPVDPGQQ